MIKTKKGDSDWSNSGKEIRAVWRKFSTLQRRNKLKLDKRKNNITSNSIHNYLRLLLREPYYLKTRYCNSTLYFKPHFGGNPDNI